MKIRRSLQISQIILLVFFISTLSVLCAEEVYADECSEILTLVNKERVAHSLNPLQLDKDLEKAAEIRGNEITIVLSHERPDGSRFSTVSPKAKGENLAGGHKSAEEVVIAWMESPGHRKNILNPRYTTIGISHIKTDTGYKNYWVQVFGKHEVENKIDTGNKVETKNRVNTKKIKVEAKAKIYLERISAVKTESKKNQVTLRWKKPAPKRVTGFEVLKYNPKRKDYNLLIKITKSSANGLVITGLKSSTIYKYQIRTYKVVNKKTYYTSPLTVTTKTKSV